MICDVGKRKSDDEEGTANAEENLEDDVEANVSDEKEK